MKVCKIEICWMILTGLLAVYGIFITIIVLPYRGADYRALLFLTRCEKESAVVEYFGRAPEIVYHKGDVMTRLGWKLPSRTISNKVLVYTNKSALRFYVYIDAEGKVEYVYSSNS